MSETLGEMLKRLRGNLSLSEVAQRTGLDYTYLRDVEREFNRITNEAVKPSPEALLRLSQVYQTSYEGLMEKAGYVAHHQGAHSPVYPSKEQTFLNWVNEGLTESFIDDFYHGSDNYRREIIRGLQLVYKMEKGRDVP